jgi:hypothetical protein
MTDEQALAVLEKLTGLPSVVTNLRGETVNRFQVQNALAHIAARLSEAPPAAAVCFNCEESTAKCACISAPPAAAVDYQREVNDTLDGVLAWFEAQDSDDYPRKLVESVKALRAGFHAPPAAAVPPIGPALYGWLRERDLMPDCYEDGTVDENEIVRNLNEHERNIMAPPADSAGVTEALGCFDSAFFEGWHEALAEGNIERIRDLWDRRLSYAYAVLSAARWK